MEVCKYCGSDKVVYKGNGTTHYYFCTNCNSPTDLVDIEEVGEDDDWRQKRRDKIVELYFEKNFNRNAVAREVGISRERVGQIIEKMFGTRKLLLKNTENFDWRLINEVRKEMGISINDIKKHGGRGESTTIRHVLMGQYDYVKNSRRDTTHISYTVAHAIMTITQERLEELNKTLEKIDQELKK